MKIGELIRKQAGRYVLFRTVNGSAVLLEDTEVKNPNRYFGVVIKATVTGRWCTDRTSWNPDGSWVLGSGYGLDIIGLWFSPKYEDITDE